MREVSVSPQMGANKMQWSYKSQESVKKNGLKSTKNPHKVRHFHTSING